MNVIRVINQRDRFSCRIEVVVKKKTSQTNELSKGKLSSRTQTTQFEYQVLNCGFLDRYWSSITRKTNSNQ